MLIMLFNLFINDICKSSFVIVFIFPISSFIFILYFSSSLFSIIVSISLFSKSYISFGKLNVIIISKSLFEFSSNFLFKVSSNEGENKILKVFLIELLDIK